MQRDSTFKGVEILVCDSDVSVRNGINSLLTEKGFVITATDNIEVAMEMIQTKFFAVVLCDLDTPDIDKGLEVVEAAVEHSPATTAIVLSPRRGWEAAVAAFRSGATDIVYKDKEQVDYLIDLVVSKAKEWKRLRNRDELLLQMGEVHEEFLKRMREMHKDVVDIHDRLQGREVLASFQLPECRVLVVDDGPAMHEELTQAFANRDDGWVFSEVQSGGEALDIGGREKFHVALVKDGLPDLPASMVTSTLRAQSPETIYLIYGAPGTPGAKVEVSESDRAVELLAEFKEVSELAGRLDEIREGFKKKAEERRYLQSFRAAQFDFLKKYAELNKELHRAKKEMLDRQIG